MAAPLNVFGSKPAGSEGLVAFVDKGFDGDDFRLVEHVGKAAIFTVLGPKEINTKNGLKTAIQANVVVLDEKPQRFENVLIFNAVPVDQLSGMAGQTTVARIDTYETKQGNTAPKLIEPDQAAIDAGNAYLASTPPF